MTVDELKITQLIRSRVAIADPTARITIFGSHSRGDAHADSDWDILVLVNQDMNFREYEDKIRHQLFLLELELEVPFSVLIYQVNNWNNKLAATSFYQAVKREGIVLT